MFKGWFDINKPFWHWFSKIPEVAALSVLWVVCCIPVVTVLPASIALYDAISRGVMNDEGGYFRRFFSTFVKELKRGIPLTLLWGAVLLILLYGETILRAAAEESPDMTYMIAIYAALYLVYFGWLSWLVPLESRYYHGFLSLHGNAFRFMLGKLPYTALLLVISIAGVALCLLYPLVVLIMPGLITALQCIFIEKAFKKQFPNDHADDVFPPGPPESDPAKPLPPQAER